MARKQKLINFHGTQKSGLEAVKSELNIGEIAVIHGSVADAALAIKISGGTGEDGQLAYFSSSNAVDTKFDSAFTAIKKEITDRGDADTKIQEQIGEGYSKSNTIASAMKSAKDDISNLKSSASSYYDKALQGITATADGDFVTVDVSAKTGTPNAGVQGLTIGVTTGTVENGASALAVASDVKAYVNGKVSAVDNKLGTAFTTTNTVQKVVGTGFTGSTLTKEIADLKALTGDTESALQAISASTTTVDALGNVQISVSEKKGSAGKHYQEIGITVTTGSTSQENKPGLAKASDVYNSIASAKSTLIGTQGDALSKDTIWGAKKYADEKIAAVKINVTTGNSYVTATTTPGHNITITTNASTDISGAKAGQVADAKAVKDYVDAVKTTLDGVDTALDGKIDTINKTIGGGFSTASTITDSVNALDGRIDKLEAISAATKSALQKVEASPKDGDSKYITFTNSVSGTTGKVVADIIIGSVAKNGSGDGLADAATVRTRFDNVENDLSGVSGKVVTLIGNDSGKSVRKIANEELAAQLIAPGADESLNSLKEIAAWIQSHPKDASAMNSKIQTIADVTFGGFDATGNTNTTGLSGSVVSLSGQLTTEIAERKKADKAIKDIIGDGFTATTTGTVTAKVNALDGRIGKLEAISGKTNSAAQGVTGKTETTATLEVKTSRDASNNVTITVNTRTGKVEASASTLVTGGEVFTAVDNAQTTSVNKANEKVETVALGAVTTATSTQSGAKISVGKVGDDKLVTLDLSELVIDCGTF